MCSDGWSAASAGPTNFGIAVDIAVLDGGAHLLHFARMDEAPLGSIDLAIQKAKTAVLFRADSGMLGPRAQPGGPLWSIENSNGGLVTFGGGVPIFDADRRCVGAVGVSGATIDQDEMVARCCCIVVSAS